MRFAPGRGYFFHEMIEPVEKRTAVFIDGQNLFWAAREAFGYTYPNFDIRKIARELCKSQNWQLSNVGFYTGVPDKADNEKWNVFWEKKCLSISRQGVDVYTRALRYRNKTIYLPDGSQHSILVGSEKGIDIRIALDIIRGVLNDSFDVCLILSQDQDLTEVVKEVKSIAREKDRWIKVACAFPFSPTMANKRGINGTDWIKIDRKLYDRCLDGYNYWK